MRRSNQRSEIDESLIDDFSSDWPLTCEVCGRPLEDGEFAACNECEEARKSEVANG